MKYSCRQRRFIVRIMNVRAYVLCQCEYEDCKRVNSAKIDHLFLVFVKETNICT